MNVTTFSWTGNETTYQVQVSAVNEAGNSSVSVQIATERTTTTSITTASAVSNATTIATLLTEKSTDLSAGGIAGIIVAVCLAGIIILAVVFVRSKSHVKSIPLETVEPASSKHFWITEEEHVETHPREIFRPRPPSKRTPTSSLLHEPTHRPDSRLWRDEYTDSLHSYSLGTAQPQPRRTSSLHGLLPNGDVQVLGHRELASGLQGSNRSAVSPLPQSRTANNAWSTSPPVPSPPGYSSGNGGHIASTPYQTDYNKDFADLRSVLMEQQRQIQEYATRALEAARTSASGQSSYENSGAGDADSFRQMNLMLRNHPALSDAIEMEAIRHDDATSVAESETNVFTPAPPTLNTTEFEEDTWL